jgi:hypothetical protein
LDYLLFTPVIRIHNPKSLTIVFGNWHFPFDLIDCAPARYTSHDTQVLHSIPMALVISLGQSRKKARFFLSVIGYIAEPFRGVAHEDKVGAAL